MSTVGLSHVHDDTDEFVAIALGCALILVWIIIDDGSVCMERLVTVTAERARVVTFCLGKALDGVRVHVELTREFEVVVELDRCFTFPVVIEPFELNGQNRR